MRLLCLHGMYQNSAVFRSKTEHLLRFLPHGVELVYLDGPINLVPKAVTKPIDTSAFRAWWDPQEGLNPHTQRQVINYVAEALHNRGPIDGVVGFSQGASLASWLCSQVAQDDLDWTPSVAIFLGGYMNPSDGIFSRGLVPDIRSFHVSGMNDRVVPTSKSEELAALFEQETHPHLVSRHTHAQGHVVPKCEGSMFALQNFLHATPAAAASEATNLDDRSYRVRMSTG
ncbi:hypothetical protein H257_11746 [Aphanomyces astaci]|uniref:Serine hydrolase domain-containing protein n=2 Tax=Aphanomyces astaci TaxID=112090 RepID=W4G3N4_APHAT|nr:hypothetical protein H257_11746 [Aphanomyces astaci]ETV73639.1 hypothetical protein H257_11746 [Aphanomyces astaci]|eukprot:XP_009837065.1 hypothetical protein H257_11746 [Aphanomyces astaci]